MYWRCRFIWRDGSTERKHCFLRFESIFGQSSILGKLYNWKIHIKDVGKTPIFVWHFSELYTLYYALDLFLLWPHLPPQFHITTQTEHLTSHPWLGVEGLDVPEMWHICRTQYKNLN